MFFRTSQKKQLFQLLLGILCAVCLSSFVFLPAYAAINPKINYQGKLTDNTGATVANGNYSMEFKLYTQVSGGVAIWTETLTAGNAVPVVNGLFSVMLGSTTSLVGVNFNQTLYLGVKIAADAEMTPRKVLGSVPAAFEARRLEGVASSSFVRSDEADTIAASTATTLLTITQNGVGDILNLFDGATKVFTVLDGGNVGIGTTTPTRTLTVAGSARITGALYDTTNSAGTLGMVFQSTATGQRWVATSTLGLGGSTFSTSAQLAALLSDETGTGRSVFSISPAFGGTATFSAITATGTLTVANNINISDTNKGYQIGGTRILYASSTNSSTLVGIGAGGVLNNTGLRNTALGFQALFTATSSDDNTAIGYQALRANTTGSLNTANGFQSLFSNTTGSENTANGYASLYSNTTGSFNTANGVNSLLSNTTGSRNTSNGYQSLLLNTTGSNNTALGYNAGFDINGAAGTGANTIIGYNTGLGITTGINNTILGANVTGLSPTLSNNIILADGAGNRRINVDGAGNVGIGTTTPSRTLTVAGSARITGALYDSTNSAGTNGFILKSTGTGQQWVATSTLGLGGSTFSTSAGLAALLSDETGTGRSVFSISPAFGGTATFSAITATGTATFATTTQSGRLTLSGSVANIALGSNFLSGDGGDEGVFVDSTGRVGIGTTTPTQQLSLTQSLQLANTINSSTGVIYKGTTPFIHNFKPTNNDGFNTFVGINAGNFTMGSSTGPSFFGSHNTAIGYESLRSNTAGGENTANGLYSLFSNTTGGSNTANGSHSLYSNTTGSNNTANGSYSLYSNTTGYENTANGSYSLYSNTTGLNNTANGVNSLSSNTTGSNNTALGYNAGLGITTGINNTILGANVIGLSPTLSNNIILADGAGNRRINVDGAGNVGIGTTTPSRTLTVAGSARITGALYDSTNSAGTLGMVFQSTATGQRWVATSTLGLGGSTFSTSAQLAALLSDETGTGRSVFSISPAFGGTATFSAITATGTLTVANNINISDTNKGYQIGGTRILYASSTNQSTLVGSGAGGVLNTTGLRNTALGFQALFTATSSDDNIAIGYQALRSNTTGSQNTANGFGSLLSNTTGFNNTANGYHSLRLNTTGSNNTANGFGALFSNTTGLFNTANGVNSFISNTTGSNNTALGNSAGRYLNDGITAASTTDNSIFLGFDSRALTADDQNSIVIGTTALGLGSNTVVLGNNSIVTTALKGNVGIGTTTPSQKLDVNGNIKVSGLRPILLDSSGTGGITQQGDPGGWAFGYHAKGSTGTDRGGFGFLGSGNNLTSYYIGTSYISPIMTLVSSTGNVGIGTTTPSRTLTVQGDLRLTGRIYDTTNSAGTLGMVFQSTATGQRWVATSTLGLGGSTFSTSAQLAALLSDETGTGRSVFSISPAFGGTATFSAITATGTATFATTTQSGRLTLSGSVANIALGSNFLSGDGGDEGIFVDSIGNVGIGSTSPQSLLTIDKNTGLTGSIVAGIKERFTFTNSTLNAVYYGDNTYIVNSPTATSTLVGSVLRIEDNGTLGNTVRGLEVQAHRGTNTKGENTGISGFGRTFGVRGTTEGDAGALFEPAGVFGELKGTIQGNALRGYSGTITNSELMSLYHDTSAFTGTGLVMNFGNGGGTFADSNSKFIDLQIAGVSKFAVLSTGATGIGTSTPTSKLAVLGTAGSIQDIFSVASSTGNKLFTVKSNGNVGIGTSTPSQELSVAGDAHITGRIYDSTNSAGSNGMVLKSTATGFRWVATSTLGIADTVVKLTAVNTYSTTQSYTKPLGMSYIVVEVWGGGGAGGDGDALGDGAGGGGGGGYVMEQYTVTELAGTTTPRIVIGAGGTVVADSTGNTGGASNFGGQATSTGGGGGLRGADSVGLGGNGGTGSGGDINLGAGAGGTGVGNGTIQSGGDGGSSPRGGGGGRAAGTGSGGRLCGGGGGGGTGTGGAGGIGCVAIYEYTTVASGADIAENYPVSDPSIGAGDIVSFAKGFPLEIQRADLDEVRPLVGIVSTAPGIVLGEQEGVGQRPVALAGRVPVKFSTENGDVEIGDRITLSSIKGIGMKAGKFDDSVGVVIEEVVEGEDGAPDTVMVFMDLQRGVDIEALSNTVLSKLGMGTSSIFFASSTGTSTGGIFMNSTNAIREALMSTLSDMLETTTFVMRKLGDSVYATMGIFEKVFTQVLWSDKVYTQELCVTDGISGTETCITKVQLDALISNGVVGSDEEDTGDGTGDGIGTTTDSGTGSGGGEEPPPSPPPPPDEDGGGGSEPLPDEGGSGSSSSEPPPSEEGGSDTLPPSDPPAGDPAGP